MLWERAAFVLLDLFHFPDNLPNLVIHNACTNHSFVQNNEILQEHNMVTFNTASTLLKSRSKEYCFFYLAVL